MTNFEKICKANPHIKIELISNESFRPYGEIVEGYDLSELISYMENKTVINPGCTYCPTVKEMEETDIAKEIVKIYCGGMPAQFGYTNGTTEYLDALEYHKASEMVIAVTDLIVLVALRSEIIDKNLDSKCVRAFYVPSGTAFEMYATTLHYCPCNADNDHFRSVVILPEGTNTDLTEKCDDKLITANNKWLICHDKCTSLLDKGVVGGVHGENFKVEN